MKKLFENHLSLALEKTRKAMIESKLDKIWIHAGELDYYYLDDVSKPFWANPDFNYYVPFPEAAGSWLCIDLENKPTLYYYQPEDFWVEVIPAPQDYWTDSFEWVILTKDTAIKNYIKPAATSAYVGERTDLAQTYGLTTFNPEPLMLYLHYNRAFKSEYELECMRETQRIALPGHVAAKQAFYDGKTEFEINLEFLKGTLQSDLMVPYGNIVAVNEHASILHYTNYKKEEPSQKNAFLLDAGTQVNGWVSDITRTYSAKDDEFQELINALDEKQVQLTSELKLGHNFAEYHLKMHEYTAELLIDFDFVRLTKEEILVNNITNAFFPHGLGHLLGIKVHDLCGKVSFPNREAPLPEGDYANLRCTRTIEPNMVFTVEPGLYFIEMLLRPWREHSLSSRFNWAKIDAFAKYGGIRIEDDIFLHEDGRIENMTRDVFNDLDANSRRGQ